MRLCQVMRGGERARHSKAPKRDRPPCNHKKRPRVYEKESNEKKIYPNLIDSNLFG